MNPRVLVTGADQHQGLAVVRGLGLGGVEVIAASPLRRNITFASRFAREKVVYTAPAVDRDRFVDDIVKAVESHGVDMVIPAVESTLVALNAKRDRLEHLCRFAAPPATLIDQVVDKGKTVELAREVGVPVPKTLSPAGLDEAIAGVCDFEFPVVVKPRGHPLHAATRHRAGFKVKYARNPDELLQILAEFRDGDTFPLIQEYAPGVGVCVSALFDRSRVVAMLPYQRVRETPLTGGVSVVRRSLPENERLRDYTVRLLSALRWRGMAMVEFKYDAQRDQYVLMEINGRFQASTALSLDAGINFPYLTYRLYAGLPLPEECHSYRVGVSERWLRGDIGALLSHLSGRTSAEAVPEARESLPGRGRALWNFIADFRPGVHFDELKWYDPIPGLMEFGSCAKLFCRQTAQGLGSSVSTWFHEQRRKRAAALVEQESRDTLA